MASSVDAMRKTIREKEPVRPTTRLAKLKGEELTSTTKPSPNPKNSPIHLSITLTFTFFRGDLRTSLTSDVGEDDALKPSDQGEHQSLDQPEDETKK